MKDVMASLPEVIKEYKGYNLLIPTATDVQLNPFYKFHVEEVAVDLSETSGDIFKVGSIDTGRKDDRGNKIYADAFSLSKPLLNKLAMAAGIQFNPEQTYGERIDRVTYRAHAQGAMRKADGTCRTETDQKEICLEDEEEKYRIEFADKAARGITDDKQAKAAAEIFKGTWTKAKNKYGTLGSQPHYHIADIPCPCSVFLLGGQPWKPCSELLLIKPGNACNVCDRC